MQPKKKKKKKKKKNGGFFYLFKNKMKQKCVICSIETTQSCSKCRSRSYCGRKCQAKDWKNGHKKMCKKLRAERLQKESSKFVDLVNDPKRAYIVALIEKSGLDFINRIESTFYPPDVKTKADTFELGTIYWLGRKYVVASVPINDMETVISNTNDLFKMVGVYITMRSDDKNIPDQDFEFPFNGENVWGFQGKTSFFKKKKKL